MSQMRANPEAPVWGGDWPAPSTQHRILVTNPAKLYGFPN
jgi:hypothetical protein